MVNTTISEMFQKGGPKFPVVTVVTLWLWYVHRKMEQNTGAKDKLSISFSCDK